MGPIAAIYVFSYYFLSTMVFSLDSLGVVHTLCPGMWCEMRKKISAYLKPYQTLIISLSRLTQLKLALRLRSGE